MKAVLDWANDNIGQTDRAVEQRGSLPLSRKVNAECRIKRRHLRPSPSNSDPVTTTSDDNDRTGSQIRDAASDESRPVHGDYSN